MRSFIITICTLLATCVFAGCVEGEDTNCSQTSGCHEPGPDGGADDQDSDTSGTCGDGVCSADDGEDADTCDKDCSGVCDDNPNNPVYCEGDAIECNPAYTDCDLPIPPNVCHSGVGRCPSADVAWNCCDSGPNDSDIYWCPVETPYWCPNSQSCVPSMSDCAYGSGNSCYYAMFSCDQ